MNKSCIIEANVALEVLVSNSEGPHPTMYYGMINHSNIPWKSVVGHHFSILVGLCISPVVYGLPYLSKRSLPAFFGTNGRSINGLQLIKRYPFMLHFTNAISSWECKGTPHNATTPPNKAHLGPD